jgi:hypothetical protein
MMRTALPFILIVAGWLPALPLSFLLWETESELVAFSAAAMAVVLGCGCSIVALYVN